MEKEKYTVTIYCRKGLEQMVVDTFKTDDNTSIELKRMKQYSMLDPEAYLIVDITENEND